MPPNKSNNNNSCGYTASEERPSRRSLDRALRRQSPLVLVEAVVAQHAALQPDQAQALYKARLKRVSSRPAWGLLV